MIKKRERVDRGGKARNRREREENRKRGKIGKGKREGKRKS